jgi:hypothetical protein
MSIAIWPRVISYLQQRTGKPVEDRAALTLRFYQLAISVEDFGLRNAPPCIPRLHRESVRASTP